MNMMPTGDRFEMRTYASQAAYQQDAAQWMARGWHAQNVVSQVIPAKRGWIAIIVLLSSFFIVPALCLAFPVGIFFLVLLLLFVLIAWTGSSDRTSITVTYMAPPQ